MEGYVHAQPWHYHLRNFRVSRQAGPFRSRRSGCARGTMPSISYPFQPQLAEATRLFFWMRVSIIPVFLEERLV